MHGIARCDRHPLKVDPAKPKQIPLRVVLFLSISFTKQVLSGSCFITAPFFAFEDKRAAGYKYMGLFTSLMIPGGGPLQSQSKYRFALFCF